MCYSPVDLLSLVSNLNLVLRLSNTTDEAVREQSAVTAKFHPHLLSSIFLGEARILHSHNSGARHATQLTASYAHAVDCLLARLCRIDVWTRRKWLGGAIISDCRPLLVEANG